MLQTVRPICTTRYEVRALLVSMLTPAFIGNRGTCEDSCKKHLGVYKAFDGRHADLEVTVADAKFGVGQPS